MKEKKQEPETQLESVKLPRYVVEMARENKKKTFMPIHVFFEKAAVEYAKKRKV